MAFCSVGLLICFLMGDPHLDRAADMLRREEFEQAFSEIEKADVEDARYVGLRNYAIFGVARETQRADGHTAAVRYFEDFLENRELVDQYVEICIWAGEEDRALASIRALPEPLRTECAVAEFQIYWARLDFQKLESRAREVGLDSWAEFAQKEQALRAGFSKHATRAWWVVLIALSVIAGIWFLLFRRIPPATRTT